MNEPLFVLLPVFNAALYLREAIESVLGQTFGDWKLVAVDDGSTDGSLALLESYASQDPRIQVLSRPNTGIVGALNDGLALCEGGLVARMDADDISLPHRFSAQVSFMNEHPGCVALGSDVLYVDPEGLPLIRHLPAFHHSQIVTQLGEGNGGALIHPSVVFRRSALEQVGGYRDRYQWIEDLDLYVRLAEVGELANLAEVHLLYRQHEQSVNRTREKKHALVRELVDPLRARHGLPSLGPQKQGIESLKSLADWRRHWAYDAARGGHWDTARKNALRALRSAPFDLQNWRCWRYVKSASRPKTPCK